MVEVVFGRRDATLGTGRRGAEVASVMVASEGCVHLRIRTSPLTMASEGGVQNRGKLWNGRHWDAEVASRMAGRWEMDARGMLVWRPNREGGGNRTPFGCECGVQNGGKLWNGRQVRLKVASRIVESCGTDATGKCERRPKSQILINRTPGEVGGGVQNGLVLVIGRQRNASVASKKRRERKQDAGWTRMRRPEWLGVGKWTPEEC